MDVRLNQPGVRVAEFYEMFGRWLASSSDIESNSASTQVDWG
jgi:hypothetical protein